jgi:hypothetical protein
MLAIHKREVMLSVMLSMCDGDFNIFSDEMNQGVAKLLSASFTVE